VPRSGRLRWGSEPFSQPRRCRASSPQVSPNLAALSQHGTNYTVTSTSRPSDSFPGLTALVTGGSPLTTGAFYDVSYDRALSPPRKTTPYGIIGGPTLCPRVVGTQVGFDEQIDIDLTKLDAGGGINPDYLPRDPRNSCAPVYPHQFIRVNTIFEVVKAGGGYTAWSDKHQSYELTNGQSGKGVDDFYAPEINSIPVALPQVTLLPCNPLPDQTAVSKSNAWTTVLPISNATTASRFRRSSTRSAGKATMAPRRSQCQTCSA